MQSIINSIRSNIESRIAYEVSKGANSAAEKVARYCASSFDYDRDDARNLISCNFKHDDRLHTIFAESMQACDVDSFDYINRHARRNARTNIYAVEKAALLMRAIASRNFDMLDVYSQVILLNTLSAHTNDRRVNFTRNELYVMMTTDSRAKEKRFNVKVKDLEKRLSVGFSTATTQVSSSLSALSFLNVLRIDDKAHAIQSVNFDSVAFDLLDK